MLLVSGVQCEIDINECGSAPCLNEGTCEDLVGSFKCYCQEGFEGLQCQHNIDDCAIDACANGGTCIDGIADFKCICPPGYSGKKLSLYLSLHCIDFCYIKLVPHLYYEIDCVN